jgi:hypothetical protein
MSKETAKKPAKKPSRTLLFVATVVIGVTSMALLSMRAQEQSPQQGRDRAQQKLDFQSRFPIADYATPEPSEPQERAKRTSKNNRFPKGRLDESADVTETLIVDGNGVERLPALPVALSDVIVVGEILNARAYLSSTKTGLFSEFMINIEEVLKSIGQNPVLPGVNVLVEREGGRIRYPSGRIRWVGFAHQGMPTNGGRYLLFLRQTEQEGTYSILTGYELRAGHVFPLDGASEFENRKLPQFAAYDSAEEGALFKAVRSLLK